MADHSPATTEEMSDTFVVGLINSPLQGVNVLECCATLALTPGLILIARESWSERSIPQIAGVLEELGGASAELQYDVSDYVLRMVQIRSARKAMRRAEALIARAAKGRSITLIVGNYPHAFWWALANHIRDVVQQVVVVDDGIGSLQIDRSVAPPHRLQDATKKALFRRLGFDERPRFRITFCSAYDLTGKLLPTDRAIANRRPLLRALAREVIEESPFPLVIGSPVRDAADSGLLVNDDVGLALSQLRFASRSYGFGRPAVYVPHHKERPEKLAAIAKHYRVTDAKLPVELEIALARQVPSHVLGLPSTAFKNLIELFPGRVQVDLLGLPSQFISEGVRARYEALYDYHMREFPDEVRVVPPSVWMSDDQ